MGTENLDSDSEYGRCVDIVLWSQMAPLFGANWCICWSCADYWEGRRSVFFQMGPLFSRKACSNSTLIIFVDRIEHLKKNKFFHILLMFVVHGFIPTLAASRRPSRSFPWPSLRRGGRFGGSPVAPSCRSTGWRSPGGPDVARSCGGHAAWRKIGNSWDENMGH